MKKPDNKKPVVKMSWDQFREAGLLWFVNMILHAFGYAIVLDIDDKTNKCVKAYPARVSFRGFVSSANTEGYKKISAYLQENIEDLKRECDD